MKSDIALNSFKKMPKEEQGLGFENLVKAEYLNMRTARTSSVANGGVNTKFSKEIKKDDSTVRQTK